MKVNKMFKSTRGVEIPCCGRQPPSHASLDTKHKQCYGRNLGCYEPKWADQISALKYLDTEKRAENDDVERGEAILQHSHCLGTSLQFSHIGLSFFLFSVQSPAV